MKWIRLSAEDYRSDCGEYMIWKAGHRDWRSNTPWGSVGVARLEDAKLSVERYIRYKQWNKSVDDFAKSERLKSENRGK